MTPHLDAFDGDVDVDAPLVDLDLVPSLHDPAHATGSQDGRCARDAERAAILDVVRIHGTLEPHRYDRGVDLPTSIVAMSIKRIQL